MKKCRMSGLDKRDTIISKRKGSESLQDIKTHDLSKLLFYSGVEYQIKSKRLNEWLLVSNRNPEIRYKYNIVRKSESLKFLLAVNVILREIFGNFIF